MHPTAEIGDRGNTTTRDKIIMESGINLRGVDGGWRLRWIVLRTIDQRREESESLEAIRSEIYLVMDSMRGRVCETASPFIFVRSKSFGI